MGLVEKKEKGLLLRQIEWQSSKSEEELQVGIPKKEKKISPFLFPPSPSLSLSNFVKVGLGLPPPSPLPPLLSLSPLLFHSAVADLRVSGQKQPPRKGGKMRWAGAEV